ncbi:MAG: alpha/beta fold hydrolase [Planctomycetaceae bacterium]|nr:alpha/beta fold hydrolase [Planctomycetaceae bacterium]
MTGIRGGHAQTILGAYWPVARDSDQGAKFLIPLDDGDAIVAHDRCPASWQLGQRIVLLVHGLGGSHVSSYMRRMSSKLARLGIRAVRMDLRGVGAGMPHARHPYHGGRSDDVQAVIQYLVSLAPTSPITAVGYSLGGNMVLKLLGELNRDECPTLDSGIAVCPPVDLRAGSEGLARLGNWIYDKFFVKLLFSQLGQRLRMRPDAFRGAFARRPRTLREFDEIFTAPLGGFRSAHDYYARASAGPLLSRIERPTWIVAAADDPIVPIDSIRQATMSDQVQVTATRHGGHLGFVGRRGRDADRHWLDWRLMEWIAALPRCNPLANFELVPATT